MFLRLAAGIIAKKNRELTLAVAFVIFLQALTAVNDHSQVIYYNWQMIICSYLAIIAAHVSRKSSFKSAYAYLLYSATYFVLAIENTLYEYSAILSHGFFDSHYIEMIYGCLIVLVVLVVYDRMAGIKLKFTRAYFNLS